MKNWGDDINYYFLREIIKSPVVLFNRTSLAFRLKLRNYLVIGSTIDMLCTQNTEVWGAGIIDGSKPLKNKAQESLCSPWTTFPSKTACRRSRLP